MKEKYGGGKLIVNLQQLQTHKSRIMLS